MNNKGQIFVCLIGAIFYWKALADEINLIENQNKAEQKKIDQNFYRSFVEEYQIDIKYRGGSNLIFDCQSRHYACVDTESFNKCIDKRNYNYSFDAPELACAPLKRFLTKEECVLYQYNVQERSPKLFFCYKKP